MNLMSHAAVQSNVTIPAGLVLGSIVAITGLLVWLTGLILVLRGADPRVRPALLRAYAICRPPLAGIKRMPVHGSRRTTDCGCLNPHSVTDCPAKCIQHGDPTPIGCKAAATTPGPAGLGPSRHWNIGQARHHQSRPGPRPRQLKQDGS